MTDAVVQELASCFNVMKVEIDMVETWIGALRSGAYKFGYGLLRSEDEEYDPFGVLAAISFAEWTWDAHEGAWAIDGDAFFIEPKVIGVWLGVRTAERHMAAGIADFLGRFRDAVVLAADGAASHEVVADLLKRAMERAEQQANPRGPDTIRGMLGDPRSSYRDDFILDDPRRYRR